LIRGIVQKLNPKDVTEKVRLPAEAEWAYACWESSTTALPIREYWLSLKPNGLTSKQPSRRKGGGASYHCGSGDVMLQHW
jgi:formylglycine-generating enzyme required for sulfatase activity